jgi:hypothetical protein
MNWQNTWRLELEDSHYLWNEVFGQKGPILVNNLTQNLIQIEKWVVFKIKLLCVYYLHKPLTYSEVIFLETLILWVTTEKKQNGSQ